MIDRGKHTVLGVGINALDYDAAVDRILDAARARRPLAVSALAVHGVMTGVLDPAQRHRLNHLDLVVPDGQPIRWALNLLHRTRLADRVYGPTLMVRVCERAAEEGLPVFLCGSTPEVLADLKTNLRNRFPGLIVAGTSPSAFRRVSLEEQEQVAATIRASGAALTFVGLGCPRQEVWVFEMRESLPMPLLAVGAAFAFHTGRLSQAPSRLQAWGLEWLFRLVQEPRRLWRRYLLLNPLYVLLLLLQALKLYTIDARSAPTPVERLGHG